MNVYEPRITLLKTSPHCWAGLQQLLNSTLPLKTPHPGWEGKDPQYWPRKRRSEGKRWLLQLEFPQGPGTAWISSILGLWVADFTSQASIFVSALQTWNTNCCSRISHAEWRSGSKALSQENSEGVMTWEIAAVALVWVGLSFFMKIISWISKVNTRKKRIEIT